jgi:hypothetical protein
MTPLLRRMVTVYRANVSQDGPSNFSGNRAITMKMGLFDHSARPAAQSPEAQEESPAGDARMQAAMRRRWIQRKAAQAGNPNARGDELERADAEPGQQVDAGIRRKVEATTGSDLGGVRVHIGSAANEAAGALKAKAYTVGQDVHFAAGQYRPGSPEGDRLIAHELIHTVQQRGAPALQNKLEVSEPGDEAEREADELADASLGGGARVAPAARAPVAARQAVIAREPEGQAQANPAQQGPAQQDGAQGPAPQEGAEGNEKVAKLTLNADVETADRTKLTFSELKEAKVGHSWISLEYNDPQKVPEQTPAPTKGLLQGGKTSMGFWPKIFRGMEAIGATQDRADAGLSRGAGTSENPAHTGFKLNPFSSWVPGGVEEPDDAHSAKGMMTYELTQAQVDSLLGYVNSKRAAQYSLYFYNCTTFAVQAVAAAGQAAPDASTMGICLPNALYKDILEEQQKGNASAETTPLEEGESQPDGTGKKKKK